MRPLRPFDRYPNDSEMALDSAHLPPGVMREVWPDIEFPAPAFRPVDPDTVRERQLKAVADSIQAARTPPPSAMRRTTTKSSTWAANSSAGAPTARPGTG